MFSRGQDFGNGADSVKRFLASDLIRQGGLFRPFAVPYFCRSFRLRVG